MKRFLMICMATLMMVSLFGCRSVIKLAEAVKEKTEETASKTETKKEETASKPTEKPTEEPTVKPTEEPIPEPVEEPAEEPAEELAKEPSEEPDTEVSFYLSDEYDFYVEINNPDWHGESTANGIAFKDDNDTYGTTQIALYSLDAGDMIGSVSLDEMVTSVVNAWKGTYGSDNVKELTEITDIDVNGNNGRVQDAEVTYMGFVLNAKVAIWVSGSRLYLCQLIGLESGYIPALPILQGMLDSFETAQDYHSRTGK